MGGVCIGFTALTVVMAALLLPWWYALVFNFSFLLLLFFFIRPDYGTYALFFLIPLSTATLNFYPERDWNFIVAQKGIDLIPVFTPFVAGTFVGAVVRKFAGVGKKAADDFLHIPICVLLCYAFATIFWSESPFHSTFQVLLFSLNVAIFWLITTHVQTEEDLVVAVRCFILSMLVQVAIYALYFFLEHYILVHEIIDGFTLVISIPGGYLSQAGTPMVDGGFLDHHELALLTNLVLAVTFGHFLSRARRPGRGWLVLLLAVFVIATLHTESRAGIASMLIMIFCAFFFFQASRKLFIRLSLLLFLLFPVVYFLHAHVVNEITGETTTPRLLFLGSQMVKTKDAIDPGLEKKEEGRSWLWKNSFRRYKETVVQGLGAGNLKRVSEAPHAHSVFLSFLFDFGLIGVVVIATIVGFLVKRFWLLVKYQDSYCQIMAVAFGAGLTAIAFHGQFDFEYNTTSLWLYLGLTVASFRLAFQEVTDVKKKW